MGYSYVRKDSNNDLFDVNPSQFMISLGVSLKFIFGFGPYSLSKG
jgi:hypothetical protein